MKPEKIIQNFRDNVSFELKQQGLTQKWLAEELGISQNAICFWLKGEKQPSLVHAQQAAILLRTNLDDLLRLSARLYEQQHTKETVAAE